MDSYEALMDNSNSISDYQSSYPQFPDNGSMPGSYGNLSGLPNAFPNSSASGGSINMSGYNNPSSQPSGYGGSSTFSMPYDPPSMQQGSTSMQISTPAPAPPSNKPIHSCTYCGLVLSSANALIEHKRIHTGDRPFACHICHKKFTQKAHLNIHKRTHTGEKPYACHICHKRFAQSSHLSSHKRIHTGEKPFVCGICHVGFTQKQRLDAHLKKHLDRPGQELIGRQGPLLGTAGQMEQFRQGPPPNDDNAFMQMIGHGMPYIKQETNLISDNVSNSNASSGNGATTGSVNAGQMDLSGGGQNKEEDKRRKTVNSSKDECKTANSTSGADSDKSPKISAPSFSSEGMFLHPSGYVAYGGIEDSDESNDQSPGSNATDSSIQHQGTTGSSSGHRRKPSFVRKCYSESPAKEPEMPLVSKRNATDFQRFSPVQNSTSVDDGNSDDESGPEEYQDTGETVDDKNDPPYHGNVQNKHNVPGVVTRHMNPPVVPTSVETRSHSRRNMTPPVNRAHPVTMNGDNRMNSSSHGGNLTYSGHSGTVGNAGLMKVNNRISLVNFTAEELITHLMKRDDVHKCQFCCLIFQDAAMYHIHRNMHDKGDVRKCNMCGKLLQDKYDFTAHFLSMHQN